MRMDLRNYQLTNSNGWKTTSKSSMTRLHKLSHIELTKTTHYNEHLKGNRQSIDNTTRYFTIPRSYSATDQSKFLWTYFIVVKSRNIHIHILCAYRLCTIRIIMIYGNKVSMYYINGVKIHTLTSTWSWVE